MGFFDHSRPLVFAHRGGCALGPENTLASFDRGIAAGADGLELDVRLSADGIPVVHHDLVLDRTCGASGPVSARTAADLQRVDAAFHYSEGGQFVLRGTGVGIPTLAAVLQRYRDHRIIIEMKDDLAAMGEAVAGVVRAAGAADRVCAAGFGARALDAARRALPDMATGAHQEEVRQALYRSWIGWRIRQPAYGGYQVPERVGRLRVVSRRFVRQSHASGLKVQVWTVDSEEDMARLLGWGVDGLISNVPDRAANFVRQWTRDPRFHPI